MAKGICRQQHHAMMKLTILCSGFSLRQIGFYTVEVLINLTRISLHQSIFLVRDRGKKILISVRSSLPVNNDNTNQQQFYRYSKISDFIHTGLKQNSIALSFIVGLESTENASSRRIHCVRNF